MRGEGEKADYAERERGDERREETDVRHAAPVALARVLQRVVDQVRVVVAHVRCNQPAILLMRV